MEVANARCMTGRRAARGGADGASPDEAAQGRSVGRVHPHYAEVVRAVSHMARDEVVLHAARCSQATEDIVARIDNDTSCVVVQIAGLLRQPRDLKDRRGGSCPWRAVDRGLHRGRVALGLVTLAGRHGRGHRRGEGQSIGNALNFGGPYLGLFATRQKYVRQMPGRIAAKPSTREGERGYVLTLSTREQHIRREKATSNICTNSGLCALAFTIHHDIARRDRPEAPRARQSRQRGETRRHAGACSERRGAQ